MSLLNLQQFPVTFWKVQNLLSETFDWPKEHLQTVIKDHKICIILNNYWIKVEVKVISRSQRLRLITFTSALIILIITKTESNNRFIIHWTKQKNESHVFASSLTGSNTKRANLIWLPVALSVLDMIIVYSAVMTSRALISTNYFSLSANQKRIRDSCIIIDVVSIH